MDGLTEHVGGQYLRTPMPGRIHGLAVWSPVPLRARPLVRALPSGAMFDRVCQDRGRIRTDHRCERASLARTAAQPATTAERREGAAISRRRRRGLQPDQSGAPARLSRCRLPRKSTHVAGDVVPLRIDRCLVRGVTCLGASALLREASDHRPIMVTLNLALPVPLQGAGPALASA